MVESNIRRGTIKTCKLEYIKCKFNDDQKIIERTILQRVISGNKEFHTDEYEMLMIDGVMTPIILPQDCKFLQTFLYLKAMTLNSCTLRSLENFPIMHSLERLELNDNKLCSGLEIIVAHVPKLRLLKLANNYFTEKKHFACFSESETLELLNIHGNPLGK